MLSLRWSPCLLAVGSIYLAFLNAVSAFDVPYCSTINTADMGKNTSIYQSNGLCYDFCKDEYAFAVVQYDGCWCSNYVPGTTTSTSSCSTPCPGFDPENCGGNGLFGYIQLFKQALGTQGGSKASSTTRISIVTETTDPETTTVIAPPSTALTSKATSSITTTRTTTSAPDTTQAPSKTSSTWTPTPVISLETITGQVRTVTVTPTLPPDSQNLNDLSRNEHKGGGGLGTGGAVGLTIGLVALVAIIGAIIFFCMKKRKQQKQAEEDAHRPDSIVGLGGPIPSRSMSEHSRYVLGTDGRQVVETWENDPEPVSAGKRKSRLMPVDPRLDPFAPVYQRGENKSRESVNTLRDDHDYSRRVHGHGPILRATNPDE